jgi:glycosyltransferase involved in cell wall biosynthesis
LGERILHVWNTAGVASVIAKFSDREFSTLSTVITRRAADRVGLTTYGTAYDDGPTSFFLRALRMSRHADVVHVHSLDRIVPWVKRLWGRPVVLHYHGTDIEGRWSDKRPRWSRADYIAVSTPNLLVGAPPGAVHVPNPVDTDLFRPMGVPRDPNSAVSFHYGMDSEAEDAAKRFGLALTWMDRWSVKHEEMPGVLSKYSYYIDMRKPPAHAVARSIGKAALEALACGCSVVDWSGAVIKGLPQENEPRRVAAKWNETYRALLRKQG